VHANESIIVRDASSKEIIAVVLWNFCGDPDVLAWVNTVISRAIEMKRNKEDTGSLVLAGYSAGARSKPIFDWACNLKSTKGDKRHVLAHEKDVLSVFALFYNLLCSRLLEALFDDLTVFLKKHGLCCMDGKGTMAGVDGKGEYYVWKGEETIVFTNEELAPLGGVMGANYARPIHSEHHPHTYGYSWTTLRQTSGGGSFYAASHGIKIEQGPDTLIVWQPRRAHGTSLLKYNPDGINPPVVQQGVSIVSSMRLGSTWEKY
ncbi:hypothetical protein DAEQUDRAFT_649121, partial [Daedalea quercina L-15889]